MNEQQLKETIELIKEIQDNAYYAEVGSSVNYKDDVLYEIDMVCRKWLNKYDK